MRQSEMVRPQGQVMCQIVSIHNGNKSCVGSLYEVLSVTFPRQKLQAFTYKPTGAA